MRRFFLIPFAAALLLAAPASAVQPDEMLDDPALETRAREISKDLRCVVCQNESIDDSNAELARDMRLLVRDRLEKGDSNQEVVQYMVDRYGDYVLLDPPFKLTTYALWFGPALFLLAALYGGWRFYRRWPTPAGGPTPPDQDKPAPLSPEEQRRLDKLLKDEERGA